MKRVYLLLTLFMTSFFLLSSNVKANTYDLSISDTNLSFIESDNFIKLKEEAIRYSTENGVYYILYNYGGYKAYFFNSIDDFNKLFYYDSPGSTLYYLFELNYINMVEYFPLDYRFAYNNKSGSLKFSAIHNNNIFVLNKFVDTNFPDLIFTGTDTFNLSSGNCSYTLSNGDKFRTLYDYYLANQNGCAFPGETEEVNPKAEIVTNFYVLVIDKIKLLTNYIATDYIILSALVIFIFVAVVGLVRRLK